MQEALIGWPFTVSSTTKNYEFLVKFIIFKIPSSKILLLHQKEKQD